MVVVTPLHGMENEFTRSSEDMVGIVPSPIKARIPLGRTEPHTFISCFLLHPFSSFFFLVGYQYDVRNGWIYPGEFLESKRGILMLRTLRLGRVNILRMLSRAQHGVFRTDAYKV